MLLSSYLIRNISPWKRNGNFRLFSSSCKESCYTFKTREADSLNLNVRKKPELPDHHSRINYLYTHLGSPIYKIIHVGQNLWTAYKFWSAHAYSWLNIQVVGAWIPLRNYLLKTPNCQTTIRTIGFVQFYVFSFPSVHEERLLSSQLIRLGANEIGIYGYFYKLPHYCITPTFLPFKLNTNHSLTHLDLHASLTHCRSQLF